MRKALHFSFPQHDSTLMAVLAIAMLTCFSLSPAMAGDNAVGRVTPPIQQRFAGGETDEVPSFQRHVVPLFGKLGCNGRACHGSFQGRGGFRLSLFGYDFKADHAALLDQESPRVDRDDPLESLILNKPTDADMHEGGLRYKKDGWEYHVLRQWVEAGAKFDGKTIEKLSKLEVTPSEIIFQKAGQNVQLKAIAVWEDGTREDVTTLCRFRTNDDQIADITAEGFVTAKEAGDTHVVAFYDNAVQPVPVIRPVSDKVGDKYPKVAAPTKIDQLVTQKLRKLGVVPSEVADDAQFLRRLRLDLTGTLPSPEEVVKFVTNNSPNKRAEKIDELLETPEYAAWWTTKLCDFTGNNARNLNNASPMRNSASKDWYDWIHKRVAANTPYDELAEGMIMAVSRKPGQSYREYCEQMSQLYRDGGESSFADLESMPYYWARRNFRLPDDRTIGFAYAFLGIRIQCAQCHKHPFDQWSKQDFADFRGFFTRVTFAQNGPREARKEYNELVEELGLRGKRGGELRRELPRLLNQGKTIPFPELYTIKPRPNRGNVNNRRRRNRNNRGPAAKGKLLGGETVDLTQYEDARQPLMEWLRDKDNPYFAKAFVNRVWANYFNVGIVEPPDDLSLANPPSNKLLLDYLTRGFIDHDYDMKWLHREIARSHTYQRSWRPNDTNSGDERNFSRCVPRRLPAEVVYDAVKQATGSDEAIAKLHQDLNGRAISLPGSGYRNRGRSGAAYALAVFGRSTRESNCDCDRSNESSLLQTVFMQNDRDVLGMIDRRDGFVSHVQRQLFPQRGRRQQGAQQARINPRQLQNLRRQINALKKRQTEADKAGNEQLVERLQGQLNRLRRRAKTLAAQIERQKKNRPEKGKKQQPMPKSQPESKKIDNTELVRQSYLRTLSRLPDESEMQRSIRFIESSTDQVAGVRGLMWALLNTKEFIVNH